MIRKIESVSHAADPTSDGRYYRYAAFLPVGLTTAGLLVALVIPEHPGAFLRGIRDFGMFFTFVGYFALLPYGLFMAIVWRFFRPEGLAAHRRMALLTPLYIAITCGLILGLASLPYAGWAELPKAFAIIGAYPLVVGYFYAVLVIAVAESAAAIARWRRRGAPPRHGLMEIAP